MELRIKYDDQQVQSALAELSRLASDNRNILMKVATIYVASTEKRFDTSTAPSGRSWKRNTATTAKLKLTGMKGRKPALMGAKPGVWTGRLATSIQYRVVGSYLTIFTDIPYAPYFSRGHRGNRHWGDTPPRPFLGQNKGADSEVVAMLQRHFNAR